MTWHATHLIYTVDALCKKLRLRITCNLQKFNAVHFRKKISKLSNFNFHLGEIIWTTRHHLGMIFQRKYVILKWFESECPGIRLLKKSTQLNRFDSEPSKNYLIILLYPSFISIGVGDTRSIIVLKLYKIEPSDIFSVFIGLLRC